jgi:hypothetical protein
MNKLKSAALLGVIALGGCAPSGAPDMAQAGSYSWPYYYVPGGGPGYGTTPPGPAPGVWLMPAKGSNYAPNGSTGWAPYSQDYMNETVHDGAQGGNGGGRR